MAQRHYVVLAGPTTVEVTSRVSVEGWTLTEKAEEGSVGSGTMWIADPAMDFDVDGLRSYYVLEDDSEATDNVLFGGFVVDPEVSRGEQGGVTYDPIARMWQIQVTDRNGFWNRRVMTGADCKRPAENDTARIAWLFGSSEANWIEDDTTYVSSASASAMDKVPYVGQYLNQVVDDCAQHTGKNWWVQLQETGAGREDVAWYGKDSLTAYSSTLYLTNDPAEMAEAELLDGTSVVWPISDQTKLKRDTSRVYTGVYLRYANSAKAIYRVNATSAAVYGRRDYVADYPNVKTKAKAIARATRLLADLAEPDERITTSVTLPKGKATKLRAGMRVSFKASHLEGYEAWQWLRVLSCAVTPVAAGERYRLDLELQGSGAVAGGGPPYTGGAFAALLKSDIVAGSGTPGTLAYESVGDGPPAGWSAEPTVGAMWTLDAEGCTITTSVAMTVRVQAAIIFSTVSDNTPNAVATLTVNAGGTIGTDSLTYSGTGLSGFGGTLTVDFEATLAAGDTVSATATGTGFLAGGWGNAGVNLTFLRVGRGSHYFNDEWWVGP